MSKKQKESSKSGEAQLDFQKETKNFNYTIVLKDQEIFDLKADNKSKATKIMNLEAQMKELSLEVAKAFEKEKKLTDLNSKLEASENEVTRLTRELDLKNAEMDRRLQELEYQKNLEIRNLKEIIESNRVKIDTNTKLTIDNKEFRNKIAELEKEKAKIIKDNKDEISQKEVRNQIKFENLKNKMMNNIRQTQSKVTELNIQYMDVSTKLTLLQNHQLLIQLEYQSQQIEELTNKKEELNKKIFELSRELEIHKEVEVSLAEKNKKLRSENNLLKEKLDSPIQNFDNFNNNVNVNVSNNNMNNNLNLGNHPQINENRKSYNSINSGLINNEFNNIIVLEKKVFNLEKKLNEKNKEFNKLKDNSEYIELRLNAYEKKYAGLFNFFEECLQLFCEDDNIRNNKQIYVNIEAIKRGDFSMFSKEEKYSILVILMKYLMPLISNNEDLNTRSGIGNINLKFHYANSGNMERNNSTNSMGSRKYLDEAENKKLIKKKIGDNGNASNFSSPYYVGGFKKSASLNQNSFDSLPSIKSISKK